MEKNLNLRFQLNCKLLCIVCFLFVLLGLSPQRAYSQSVQQDIKTLTDAMISYEQIISDLSKTIENYQGSQKDLEAIQQSYQQLEIDYEALLKTQEQLAKDYKRKQAILGSTLGSVALISIISTIVVATLPQMKPSSD